MRLPRTLALVGVISLATVAQSQTVHVVDVNGGPGSDFTSITAAITAAVAGDTLLIRAGNYNEFPTVTRGITLQAELGAVVTVTDLSITVVPAGESATIRGLTITEGPGVAPGTLRVSNCDGTVFVEDCQVLSAAVPFQSGGVRVTACEEVIFTRCYIQEPAQSLTPIGDTFVSTSSGVFLYDTEVYGENETGGQDGWAAIRVNSGYLAISGGIIAGGDGGDGFFFFCDGGDGGDGLVLSGIDPEVLLLGPAITAGKGGLRDQPQCSDGVDGVPIQVDSGFYVSHTGTAPRFFEASSPTREGEMLTVTIDNLAALPITGDFLWVMVSALPGGGVDDPYNLFGGLLAVGSPRLFFAIGPTGGQNTITLSRTLPELGPGIQGGPVYLQGLFWDESARALVPTSPSAAVVLDSGF